MPKEKQQEFVKLTKSKPKKKENDCKKRVNAGELCRENASHLFNINEIAKKQKELFKPLA